MEMKIRLIRSKKPIPKLQKAAVLRRSIALVEEAARVFIHEVARNTTVDTGMTIGGLIPVSRFLKIAGFNSLGVGSKKGAMVGWHRGKWDKSLSKGPGLGASLSERGDAWDFIAGSPNKFGITFWFEPQVFQHILQDLGYGGGAAWNSVQKGRMAMLDYIRENSSKVIPKFSEWLYYG